MECERCGFELSDSELVSVSLDQSYDVCETCEAVLVDSIVEYDWQDRYTEKQHERALTLLRKRDEIHCVRESYEQATIIVHTPYVDSAVIKDFCEHFGFIIVSFGPWWRRESESLCKEKHDSLFEIVLKYKQKSDKPVPTTLTFEEIMIDRLDENDRQF